MDWPSWSWTSHLDTPDLADTISMSCSCILCNIRSHRAICWNVRSSISLCSDSHTCTAWFFGKQFGRGDHGWLELYSRQSERVSPRCLGPMHQEHYRASLLSRQRGIQHCKNVQTIYLADAQIWYNRELWHCELSRKIFIYDIFRYVAIYPYCGPKILKNHSQFLY